MKYNDMINQLEQECVSFYDNDILLTSHVKHFLYRLALQIKVSFAIEQGSIFDDVMRAQSQTPLRLLFENQLTECLAKEIIEEVRCRASGLM